MTEKATYRFTVKEGATGKPFLYLEPLASHLSILAQGALSLDLAEGTNLREAEELATTLNERVVNVAYTSKA